MKAESSWLAEHSLLAARWQAMGLTMADEYPTAGFSRSFGGPCHGVSVSTCRPNPKGVSAHAAPSHAKPLLRLPHVPARSVPTLERVKCYFGFGWGLGRPSFGLAERSVSTVDCTDLAYGVCQAHTIILLF